MPYKVWIQDKSWVLSWPRLWTREARKQNFLWFNPPYNSTVKTNVGKVFLKIVDESFPISHPLRHICNQNNIKISYCTMSPISAKISGLNQKKLYPHLTEELDLSCNCHQTPCPLGGRCNAASIIYTGKITPDDGEKPDTYVGLCSTKYAARYRIHKRSFLRNDFKYDTALSVRAWELKSQGRQHKISFDILQRAKTYIPGDQALIFAWQRS